MIRAQRLDDEGAPLDDPMFLADALFGRRVIARADGSGVLVAYAANGGSTTEVFTVELQCVFDF